MEFCRTGNNGSLKLGTGKFYLEVVADPLTLEFMDAEGNVLTKSCSIGFKGPNSCGEALQVKKMLATDCSGNEINLRLQTEQAGAPELKLSIKEVNSSVFRLEVKGDPCVSSVLLTWTLDPGDHFYGFGERFDSIDQKGNEVELWVENGAYGGKTYKPVPFLMTPRGYGMMLDTTRRCLCRMGRPGSEAVYSIENIDASLDFYFIYGPELKEILSKYLQIVGTPELPPPWMFGAWKSRDWLVEEQRTVYQDLEIQRQLKVPCTVKLIDACWETEYHSFTFDGVKYPAPEQMFAAARKKGYKIVLWISPWIMAGTTAFARAEAAGYLLKKADGSTYVNRLGNDPGLRGAVIDFTNPAAKAWWQDNLQRLMEMGAAGFKTDFGEQVPVDAVFCNGKTGAEMHNLFPKLYNEVTWEVVGPRKGVLLARSAWHGSQRYPGIWAGDQSPDFCPWSGLPSVIRAALSAGLSGFPFWTSDIGGYFGPPAKNVFIRWAQFGAFSPMMQVHGMGEHDPWNFDAETLHIYRGYAELHTRLFPYLYRCAVLAAETGWPVMRALPLEYQHDPVVYDLEAASYQYLFGDSLLVAPVFFGGKVREVYLPAGQWVDWWTGQNYEGPQVLNYEVPLQIIPVFVRRGCLLPLLPAGVETLLPAEEWGIVGSSNELELEIYPAALNHLQMADGQEFTVRETGGGFVVKARHLRAAQLTLKFMGYPDLSIESLTGCTIVETGMAVPAVARIEPLASRHHGYQVVLKPTSPEVSLVVRK